MKRFKWLTLLLAFALFAAACGGSDSGTTEAADGAPAADTADDAAEDEAVEEEDVALSQGSGLTFHMITHSDDGPFWSVLKSGAEAAAAAGY